LQQCGKYGRKEIIEFSMSKIAPLSRWWTKLRRYLSCG